MLNLNFSFSTRLKFYYGSRLFLQLILFIIGVAVVVLVGFGWGYLGFLAFPSTLFAAYLSFSVVGLGILGVFVFVALEVASFNNFSIFAGFTSILKSYNSMKEITTGLENPNPDLEKLFSKK